MTHVATVCAGCVGLSKLRASVAELKAAPIYKKAAAAEKVTDELLSVLGKLHDDIEDQIRKGK